MSSCNCILSFSELSSAALCSPLSVAILAQRVIGASAEDTCEKNSPVMTATWDTATPIERDDAYPKLPGRAGVTGWLTCTDTKSVSMVARRCNDFCRRRAFLC